MQPINKNWTDAESDNDDESVTLEWLTRRLDTIDLYDWQERNRNSRKGTHQASAIESIYLNLALVRSNSRKELEEFYRNIPKAFKTVHETAGTLGTRQGEAG